MKNFIILICLSISLCAWSKEVKLYHQADDLLDISERAYERSGRVAEQIDSIDMSRSFSVFIRVKTDARQLGKKALVTNKKVLSLQDRGFIIGTQENGSWMVGFSDGKNEPWEYSPTAKRQPINDGKWHYIGLTHDADKQEMRMYYDGRNVAIYCTNGNNNLATHNPFRLGGIDNSQWNAFNGYMKDFYFTDKVLDEEAVRKKCGKEANVLQDTLLATTVPNIKIMTFNIYHGGRELGEEVGVNRVIDVIRQVSPDVIGIIETYGSGAIIADALGYYFYLRSSNLSIMSRYPIEETHDFFKSFNCSAATIRISAKQKINYLNIWLDYLPNTHEQLQNRMSPDSIVAGEWKTRAKELNSILKDMRKMIADTRRPLFVSGDFNIASHLDWGEDMKTEHDGYIIEWPTSKLMEDAGFKDSYRVVHPDPSKKPCLTWSTMAKNELQYRIDYIYYKGKVKPIDSWMIDKHPGRFPSDHAAVSTLFEFF